MGPRSVERGKGVHSVTAPGGRALQWGRVLLNAESEIKTTLEQVNKGFNGAAFC